MELPQALFKINSLTELKDIDQHYTDWLISTDDILSKFDKLTKHHICYCVRSQVALMVSWEKSMEGEFNEISSQLILPKAKINIIVQLTRDKVSYSLG
jgi:hypothetical protein